MRRIVKLLLIALLFTTPVSAAWTHVNTEGFAEKVSSTTIVLNPATNPATDSIVVVACSTDNPDNTGPGEKTFHTITDDQGRSWARLMEYQSAGNSNAGVITSVWASKLGATITGNITCTLNSSRNAKVLIMSEYTVAASKTFSHAGTARTSGTGTGPKAVRPPPPRA